MEPRASVRGLTGAGRQPAVRGAVLAGRPNVLPDDEDCARFGVEIESERGALLRAGGLVEVDWYDGHTSPGCRSGYADWLRARGYASADPWSDFVIAAMDGERVVSGWQMRNAYLPARCGRNIPRPPK